MTPPFYSQLQLLILFAILGMLAASVVNSRYAPAAYLLIMLFRPGEVFSALGAIRFELLAVIYLVALIVLKGRLYRLSPGYHPINKAFILFSIVCLLSTVQAVSVGDSFDYAYRLLFPLMVFFALVVTLSDDINDVKFLVVVYLVIVTYLSYLPLYDYLHGIGAIRAKEVLNVKGETGGVEGHVALANLMTQTLPFAFFFFLNQKGLAKKGMLAAFIGFFVTTTVATGSRGGFVGLIICGALIAWRSEKKGVTIPVLLAGAIFAASLMSSGYMSWMSTSFDVGNLEYSAQTRFDGLRHGIEMAAKRPILGVGLGCYAIARSNYFGWYLWAHNLYGELIGELGLVGLICWPWLIYLYFKEIRRIRGFVDLNPHVDPLYLTIINSCWAVLLLRLAIGMLTHSLMADVWYMIGAMLVVTSKSLEETSPEFAQAAEVSDRKPVVAREKSI